VQYTTTVLLVRNLAYIEQISITGRSQTLELFETARLGGLSDSWNRCPPDEIHWPNLDIKVDCAQIDEARFSAPVWKIIPDISH
jgi:hypothetical protein